MRAQAAIASTALALPEAANAGLHPRSTPMDLGGEILLALSVGRGATALFGWHRARLPRQGNAFLAHADGHARGPYRLHAWRRDDAGTAWFVAVLDLRHPGGLATGGVLSIATGAGSAVALGVLPEVAGTPEAMARELTRRAADQPGPLALFLADLVGLAPRAQALQALSAAFLQLAAAEDGVIEIVGQTPEALLLQGWGRCDPAQPAVALLGEGAGRRHAAQLASFIRGDIPPPAQGMVVLVEGAHDAASLSAVHMVSGPALYRRRILPERQLLDAGQAAGHLRAILTRLSCPPETTTALQRLLRPRFTGHDTLSTLDRPVRAAIDLAAIFPGAGAFLAGWMVDPQAEVERVTLCDTQGLALRLDGQWTRLSRPDVAEAFRSDARFAGLAESRPLGGLAAFVPAAAMPAASPGLHLELKIGETSAFLPLGAAAASQRQLLRRALASIDLHQAGGHAAICAQLGPLARALLQNGLELPAATTVCSSRAVPRRALLLPLPGAGTPSHAALSPLLADPLAPDEGLVLVAPAGWTERELAALESALPLYAPEATVLRVEEECSWVEALELAARASGAAEFLCLGAGVIGRCPGWRRALAARRGDGVVFPTALYEDDAVRSIGVTTIEALPGAPWARLLRPGAGMPWAGRPSPGATLLAGSLAGALVARAAWQAAGGFAGGGLLDAAQELGFFRRLAAAGGTFTHSPDVSVYAVADGSAAPPPTWQQAARLVDGWLLATDAKAERCAS